MVPTYSVFAAAINKAVKGTLHFSHMYPNGELKAFEEHLLIKCYNRFARRSDSEYTRLSKEDGGGGGAVTWGRRDVAEAPGAEGSKLSTQQPLCLGAGPRTQTCPVPWQTSPVQPPPVASPVAGKTAV